LVESAQGREREPFSLSPSYLSGSFPPPPLLPPARLRIERIEGRGGFKERSVGGPAVPYSFFEDFPPSLSSRCDQARVRTRAECGGRSSDRCHLIAPARALFLLTPFPPSPRVFFPPPVVQASAEKGQKMAKQHALRAFLTTFPSPLSQKIPPPFLFSLLNVSKLAVIAGKEGERMRLN